jgi:hypothetical protein
MAKLLGFVEEFHDIQDLEAWGQLYNGRTTFYLFYIPLYIKGFNHSTTYLGD